MDTNISMCLKLVRVGHLDRLLTAVHQQTRVELCNYQINQLDSDSEQFIMRIVISDLTRINGYDPSCQNNVFEDVITEISYDFFNKHFKQTFLVEKYVGLQYYGEFHGKVN